jgi:hypothetical protein
VHQTTEPYKMLKLNRQELNPLIIGTEQRCSYTKEMEQTQMTQKEA